MEQVPSFPGVTQPQTLDPDQRLYRHILRKQWGVGLWVKEEPTRRRLRFEDGELRAFKKGFYHLLRPVDPDRIEIDEVFERVATDHELAEKERVESEARRNQPPVMSFGDQCRVFEMLYPKGFGGTDFRHAHRAPLGGKGKRKSHFDPASESATVELSEANLTALLDQGRFDDIYQKAVAVLSQTSLVIKSKGEQLLTGIPPEAKEAFSRALIELLYSEEPFGTRFAKWLETLRGPCRLEVRWPLATVFPALVFPDRHVCVRHEAFELQSRSVKPGTTIPKRPSKRGYRTARRITRLVLKRLSDEGLEPRDMQDVRIFVWETLRPKARTMLKD